MKKLFMTLAVTTLLVGCEVETEAEIVSDDSSTINDSVLEGEVGGRSWTHISGRAKPSNFGDDSYSLAFWNEDINDPCDSFSMGSESQLLGFFPMSVGTHRLGNSNNINFAFNSQNNIATDGRLVITEITGDVVYGEMIATFDNSNYVNGTFELTLCE